MYPSQAVGNGVQGSIWSELEMAMATISACLPTLRPLFTKRIPDGHYIHKDFTVNVTSGRPPPNRLELSEPPSYCEDLEGRPFVKLEGQEEEFI